MPYAVRLFPRSLCHGARAAACRKPVERPGCMQVFERQYGSDLEGSQIYAAYKYPRKDVKAVRPGPAVAAARPFSPDMVEVAYDGSTRRVGPFEMVPGTAAGVLMPEPNHAAPQHPGP